MIIKMGQILLLSLGFMVFSQCGGIPPTYYYRLSNGPAIETASSPIPVSIAVMPFETDIAYEGDRIVYRSSPYEINYYHYRRWIAPPPRLVTDFLFNHFQNSRIFEQVVRFPVAGQTDYLLKGNINAFEEWDEAERWYGHVSLNLELIHSETGRVIWSGQFHEKTPVPGKKPLEVVKAINQSLKKIGDLALQSLQNNILQEPVE